MNTFMTQLFSTYATADLKTYLGRASEETEIMLDQAVAMLMENRPDTVLDGTEPNLDLFIKLHDKRFTAAVEHLTKISLAFNDSILGNGATVREHLDIIMAQMVANSAACAKWYKAFTALMAAKAGNYAALDELLLEGDDAVACVLSVMQSLRSTGRIDASIYNGMTGVTQTTLGNALLRNALQ